MKIMTDRQFREELEKALLERDRLNNINERFDRLERQMWDMEDRLRRLERRLENVGATPVNDCASKMETTRNG